MLAERAREELFRAQLEYEEGQFPDEMEYVHIVKHVLCALQDTIFSGIYHSVQYVQEKKPYWARIFAEAFRYLGMLEERPKKNKKLLWEIIDSQIRTLRKIAPDLIKKRNSGMSVQMEVESDVPEKKATKPIPIPLSTPPVPTPIIPGSIPYTPIIAGEPRGPLPPPLGMRPRPSDLSIRARTFEEFRDQATKNNSE